MKLSDLQKVTKLKEKREELLAVKTVLAGTCIISVEQVQGTSRGLATLLSTERHATAQEQLTVLVDAELADVNQELAALGVTIE
jgi:hypothetical protein